MKIAVIGCGAAGATAAQFARKHGKGARITIYDREGYGEYSKCALPMVISGELTPDEIVEYPPEWFRRAGIEYRNEEVEKIDMETMEVFAKDVVQYDSIIIATGAGAGIPFEAKGAYVLRNIEDAIAIRKRISKGGKAIVVGAGLIGMEVAEALKYAGMDVMVIEYMPSILPAMLDKDMASHVEKMIKGIEIKTGCKVSRVDGNVVEADDIYEGDFVVISTGNKANTRLCKSCKIEKGIVVDEYSRVKDGIYAAGDCTQITDFFGNKINVGLGTIAVRQGRIAGMNAVGKNEKMIAPVWAKTTQIFGIEIASVGLLENNFYRAKHSSNLLPEYMKGEKIMMKIIANEEGTVVGAQAAGKNASHYINRIAYAIYKKMHLKEIAWFENAYAPKIAPVFDTINLTSQSLLLQMRRKKNGKNI